MEDAHESPAEHAQQPTQHSFLIRFWRTTPRGAWHVTLQRATHEPALHFAGVDLLFAFLLTQLGEEAPLQQHAQAGEGVDAPADDTPDASP